MASSPPAHRLAIVPVLASLGAAFLTYRLVEWPVLQWKQRVTA